MGVMMMRVSRPTDAIALATTTAALFCALLLQALAQEKPDFERQFKRASELIKENKLLDALPLLEELHATNTSHPGVLELLAYSLSATAVAEADGEKRKRSFLRARQLAERAWSLGHRTKLVGTLLEQIPSSDNLLSVKGAGKPTPAEQALVDGEAAFAKGEMERAIQIYERASQLDPKLYEAPLFIGDAHFKLGRIDKAGECYARAIAINPDRDAAYRYWGSVLLQSGRVEEAKAKLIEAVIASPYSRPPWQFLKSWADRAGVELHHPRIDVPKSSVVRKDQKQIDIQAMLSEKKDGTDAWTVYSLTRAGWMMEEKQFKQAYPNEPQYRHSLREEANALAMVVESVQLQLKEGTLKESNLNVSILNLLKLHKAGLIEAYVLLAMPDEGIAKDYVEYRKSNRDQLRKYLNEYVAIGR
jgi:tetratricopeptide (TPR) repeat protein